MIINFDNIGGSGGGGGQYVLPVATANRLGGIKVGSGLTIDSAGVLSASGGTAPSDDSVKVYIYDELYSGDTYDHFDRTIMDDMIGFSRSGTPVYVLYRNYTKTIYMELTDIYSANQLGFRGVDGHKVYSCSMSYQGDHWVMTGIVDDPIGEYSTALNLPSSAHTKEGNMVAIMGQNIEYPIYYAYIDDESSFPDNGEGSPEGGYGVFQQNGVDIKQLYNSDGNFFWNYENDNVWHEVVEGFWYKTDIDIREQEDKFKSKMYYAIDENKFSFVPDTSHGVATGATNTTFTGMTGAATYLRHNGKWLNTNPVYQWEKIKHNSSAETIELFDTMVAQIENGMIPIIFGDEGKYAPFREMGWYGDPNDGGFKILMFGTTNSSEYFQFTIARTDIDGDGFEHGYKEEGWGYVNDPTLVMGGVDSGGTNGSDLDYLTNGTENSNLYRYAIRFANPDNPDEYLSLGLVSFWYKYKVVADNDEGWQWYYVIGADVPIDTTIYHGVWGWVDNEHIETLQWTSGNTYESQTYTKYVPQP